MGFFDKLKNGLNKTKISFDEKINNVFSNFRKVDEELLEELEEVLIMSDVGTETSLKIISKLREKLKWWDKSIEEINNLISILTSSDLEKVKEELSKLV